MWHGVLVIMRRKPAGGLEAWAPVHTGMAILTLLSEYRPVSLSNTKPTKGTALHHAREAVYPKGCTCGRGYMLAARGATVLHSTREAVPNMKGTSSRVCVAID